MSGESSRIAAVATGSRAATPREVIADEIRARCGEAFKMPDLMAWGIVKRLQGEGYFICRAADLDPQKIELGGLSE